MKHAFSFVCIGFIRIPDFLIMLLTSIYFTDMINICKPTAKTKAKNLTKIYIYHMVSSGNCIYADFVLY